MLRSLILSTCVLASFQTFAHGDHSHDHDHDHENSRTYLPISCREAADTISEQCKRDAEALAWIHEFLSIADTLSNNDGTTGALFLDEKAYETLIFSINAERAKSPAIANFRNDFNRCKTAFSGLLEVSENRSSKKEILPGLMETFCKHLGPSEQISRPLWHYLVLGGIGVFTGAYALTGSFKGALTLAGATGTVAASVAVCPCHGTVGTPCSKTVAALTLGALGFAYNAFWLNKQHNSHND